MPHKRRRRLPPNIRSIDMVKAMHEEAEVETDEKEYNSQNFCLSNSDRHQRARRSHLKSQQSCSMLGISMKAVMNASQIPKATAKHGIWGDIKGTEEEDVITTLTHDSAVLRRDLYKQLATLDTAEINTIIKQSKCSSNKCCKLEGKATMDDTLTMKIKGVTSALLRRITSNPTSPSMRLSAIIALDSLRELELSDWGYRCILDELLDANASWSLPFYAEIVSECSAYEKPLRLLRISELMQQALQTQKLLVTSNDRSNDMEITIPLLLRTISHIMVRRQSILFSFNQDAMGSPLLRREIDAYKRLCTRISVRYDSIASWVSSTMPSDVRESVISALQAEGILSFFCCGDSDDEDQISTFPQTSKTVEEYPYPCYLSLRAAHDRMGPCDGFNRLLSHPAAYEHCPTLPSVAGPSNQPSIKEAIVCPLSSAHDDILIIVFSYLGYRSLARASQCCISWKRASNAPTLWAPLYFKKYRNICFEEELTLGVENAKKDHVDSGKFLSLRNSAERQQLATSEEGYDWNYIFKSKYATEKRCRAKTCNIVGCLYVIRRADHARSHRRR